MHCSHCGAENAANVVFCSKCGSQIGSTPPVVAGQRRPDVPTYLVHAILVTLFCCLPFGIVAIVKAAQVSSLTASGDYPGAVAASEAAKKWSLIGAVSGVVLAVIWTVISMLGVGAASSGF